MRSKRTAVQTKELILEACSRILAAQGARSLTLDAVAQEAGVSKGGLLYHFPNKRILVSELFKYHGENFDRHLSELAAAASADSGGWLRAYARASIAEIVDKESATLLASLYAAADEYPEVHDIMRSRYDEWQARIDQSRLDPVLATLIRLAVDGLWFAEMYQYAPPDEERREQILALIDTLTH